MVKRILVTGGSGYIGSHTCVSLLENDYEVIVIDNLSNSKVESLKRVEKITGKEIKFFKGDILDKWFLRTIFTENKIDAVIHFAGLKAVGESTEIPLVYYENNISGTICLLEVMKEFKVKNIIFSSSATVYGAPEIVPIKEEAKLSVTNPYGRTKLMIEEILKDLYASDHTWNIAILRYFNPIGAHPSGMIGEDPKGIPNNLVPYVTQTAIGKREYVRVFGNDYDTKDGTGVRDYIHICDLADGHVAALKVINEEEGIKIYNIGTGIGYSVLDIINAFSKTVGFEIPYKVVERRKGDIDYCYADPTKAYEELKFKTKRNLEDMCKDHWLWQKNNPNGYEE